VRPTTVTEVCTWLYVFCFTFTCHSRMMEVA